ncbi:MAG: cation diffusion facilitator family transporter [Phocaeicola sp.]
MKKEAMYPEEQLKQRIQLWIVSISVVLLLGKFAVYYITNSVGIFTDAMESIVNVVAGFISLYSLRWAAQPKDKEHPFGHGKMELISASIEGLLIAVAGGIIFYEGVKRLFLPTEIQELDLGILVVAVAGAVNYVMGWYSIRIGKRHHSMALVAGGKHLQSDTYSTIGLVAGLLLLKYTQLLWIDSALALLFGGIIIATGVSILRKTVTNLLDGADEELLKEVAQSATENRQLDWIDIHNTKIIKSGSYLYIDCDLTLPWYYNLEEGHQACDSLKKTFTAHFSCHVQATIHTDPCNKKRCTYCSIEACQTRQSPFVSLQEITTITLVQSDEERSE